jgi:hypothetical protein
MMEPKRDLVARLKARYMSQAKVIDGMTLSELVRLDGMTPKKAIAHPDANKKGARRQRVSFAVSMGRYCDKIGVPSFTMLAMPSYARMGVNSPMAIAPNGSSMFKGERFKPNQAKVMPLVKVATKTVCFPSVDPRFTIVRDTWRLRDLIR